MTSQPRTRRNAISTSVRALLVALAFGLTGTVFGAHRLASATLRHIVTNDPSLSFQEVSDYLPVPRKLDWNMPLVQALKAQRETAPAIIAVSATLLLVGLWALFLWLTRSRLEDPAAAGQNDVSASVVATSAGDGKNEVSLEAVAPDDHPPSDVSEGHGHARSDVGEAEHRAERKKRALKAGWALRAILCAGCILMLMTYGVPAVPPILLRYYHTLGTFHQGYWLRIAAPSLVNCMASWAAGGLLLFAVFAAGARLASRAMMVGFAAILFVVAFWQLQSLRIQSLSARHDWNSILTITPPYRPDRMMYGVPDGYFAARRLANLAGIKVGEQPEQPERPVVLFLADRVFNVTQRGITEDGLAATAASVKPVRGLLERRNYETALSWVAVKHIFNVAAVHFDTTTAVDICMTDMERCPHLSSSGLTVRTMLFTCAASEANLAVMDRWADERLFVHPTRESQRLMGQLYERFGERDKALIWYRRADMPRSFLKRVEMEKPVFHAGRIDGRILLNGKPLEGAQVGVVPARLNGLPIDLEQVVLRSRTDILMPRPTNLFPAGYPRPYSFHWISASSVTDPAGNFQLSHLTEGEYMLVCTLPSTIHLQSPVDPFLSITNSPAPVVVNYRHPVRGLGTITIKTGR